MLKIPPTQTVVEESQYVEVSPIAALTQAASTGFVVQGNNKDYIDLFNTFLYLRAKFTLTNGDSIALEAEVALINVYLNRLVSQVDVLLNNTLITPSENIYASRAYMEAVLNYGEVAKRNHLISAIFSADTPTFFNATEGGFNNRLKLRHQNATLSKEMDMMSRLLSDIFTQHRYMINGVDIKVKLTSTTDLFNLITPDTNIVYKSVIMYEAVVVRKAEVNPSI